MERADIAIIGGGPAGISAALNVQIRRRSFYLFGSNALSDKVQRAECIANYPALPDIGGPELNQRMLQQLSKAQISIIGKRVTGIYRMENHFALLAGSEHFEVSAVILATGVETVRPVAGERELLGRGVSYCATCDGNLYRGKRLAVVCDHASMEEEVVYLAGLAGTIYYLPLFQSSSLGAQNVERLPSPITEILGEERVTGIRCRDGTEIAVDGVFFLKQSVSPAVLLPGLEIKEGHVTVNRRMETNLRGCFAAGDCTGGPYQITKAAGEGNIAAHSAFQYLAEQSHK